MNIRQYVYYLLTKRDYFEKELRSKLLRKGFQEKEIESILAELKENNLIDDERLYTRLKEKSLERGISGLRLKKKLYLKGFEDTELSFDEELTSALNLLKRSFKKEKNFENVVKFLKNRGFRFEVIKEAVEKFLKEEG